MLSVDAAKRSRPGGATRELHTSCHRPRAHAMAASAAGVTCTHSSRLSTGSPLYPPGCHIASSCLPLGSSRQMKGVFLGTAGGADPPLTPTAQQHDGWAGTVIETGKRHARSLGMARCRPCSFPRAFALHPPAPHTCDGLHALVSQDRHGGTRQTRDVPLRRRHLCMAGAACAMPSSCASTGCMQCSASTALPARCAGRAVTTGAGRLDTTSPHTAPLLGLTLGGRPKALSRSWPSRTPKASRSGSYSSACGQGLIKPCES